RGPGRANLVPECRPSGRVDFHEQLGRRARADRQRSAIFAAEQDGVSCGIPPLDLNRLAGFEVVALDKTEKRRVLIGDARDAEARALTMGAAVPGVTPSVAATMPMGTSRWLGDRFACP